MQLINDVSVQVEVGGACLCDSTAAPPLHDIATVAITDYYNSYVSSGTSIDRSADTDALPGYRHVRLSARSDKINRLSGILPGDREKFATRTIATSFEPRESFLVQVSHAGG